MTASPHYCRYLSEVLLLLACISLFSRMFSHFSPRDTHCGCAGLRCRPQHRPHVSTTEGCPQPAEGKQAQQVRSSSNRSSSSSSGSGGSDSSRRQAAHTVYRQSLDYATELPSQCQMPSLSCSTQGNPLRHIPHKQLSTHLRMVAAAAHLHTQSSLEPSQTQFTTPCDGNYCRSLYSRPGLSGRVINA